MKTGQTAGQSNQTSPVISHSSKRPVAVMAGQLSRKIPDQKKAGQDVAGEANQVKITHGSGMQGKVTWKGAAKGYTTREIPPHKPAEVGLNTLSSGNRAKQKVK